MTYNVFSGTLNPTQSINKAASPRHTDDSAVFARWRQYASHVTHTSFSPPESTTKTTSQSVQRFFASLVTECHHACPGIFFPMKIGPLHGDLHHQWNTASLVPPESKVQTASQSVQPFLHSSCQSVVRPVRAYPSSSELLVTLGDLDPI